MTNQPLLRVARLSLFAVLALFTVSALTLSGASAAQTVGGTNGAKSGHGKGDDYGPCERLRAPLTTSGVVASGGAVANNPGYALDATRGSRTFRAESSGCAAASHKC